MCVCVCVFLSMDFFFMCEEVVCCVTWWEGRMWLECAPIEEIG